MPTPKKYRLLKDTILSKANTVFTLTNKKRGYMPEPKMSYEKREYLSLEQVENNPDWFEIIPDQPVTKSDQLETPKYRNRSEVNAPKKVTEYWHITNFLKVEDLDWDGDEIDFANLARHNIFLTKEAAEQALHRLEVYNRICRRIDEINRENAWTFNPKMEENKAFFVRWNYYKNCKAASEYFYCVNQGTIYMSEQANDWLLSEEVSDEDFRIFVEY